MVGHWTRSRLTLPVSGRAARPGPLDWRVGRLVPKRANGGVLQKRSCAVWLLCYSNNVDSATGETKWQRNK